ncbi:hypothetical protein [Lacticaseibacillus manihotivorans]|uniref:hypothetical protein n=1 Tax=Lacticaseibacillus manihotivorans TaxID=88233 RepID=UPI0006D09D49|nr:hypothetical protein [Lacticaseibacillus manihotivorans]
MKSLWSLLNVFFGIVFVVVAIHFFLGKWLNLLAGSSNANTEQLAFAGKIISPALIVLGVSVFLLGFQGSKLCVRIGNVSFVIAIGYIVIMVIITMFRASK